MDTTVKHYWTIICSRAIVDQERNTISLIDVLEQINIKLPDETKNDDAPVILPIPMTVASYWQRDTVGVAEHRRTRLTILDPDNHIMVQSEQGVDLTSHERSRNMLYIDKFPFRGEGAYLFVIDVLNEKSNEWDEVAVVPLEIRKEIENRKETTKKKSKTRKKTTS